MLDTRRFRSPQTAQDGPDKTMLGETQKSWLEDKLSTSKAKFKFIVTSVPFQGGGVDTWGVIRQRAATHTALYQGTQYRRSRIFMR
jgi:phosphodiesterase/alkaline phosphatase D-like protein